MASPRRIYTTGEKMVENDCIERASRSATLLMGEECDICHCCASHGFFSLSLSLSSTLCNVIIYQLFARFSPHHHRISGITIASPLAITCLDYSLSQPPGSRVIHRMSSSQLPFKRVMNIACLLYTTSVGFSLH